MLNRAILFGRLTRDPDLRYTTSGTAVCMFTLAIPRRMIGENGERETDFLPIVVWGKLAELCAEHLKKGQQAAVEGRIQIRNFQNKEGRRVYVTEIAADHVQFLSSSYTATPEQSSGFEQDNLQETSSRHTRGGGSGVNFGDYYRDEHRDERHPDEILIPGDPGDGSLPF
ncbi:single-stranded DNA-binding protein [Aneurinibacillus thermoaerophilus]|uniref:single-stranded DNA-binding protein n=1 Tax=Aneurinibacillus thermoaerophilus TaxID=143495 RepID=UPI002E1FC34F|nr:single-stranded DNA-binding protein [Aneurinibacillus thermoaerophilus]